ncbi:MAG: valine--tRNA ligase [Chloroflexi bacterium]|nr:valine--tRNA ligase [Chloroflexota bacterium]
MSEIPKAYEPGKIENKWYSFWLERGYFTPKIDPGRRPFVIIMPPANVTGELHLGHALTSTLEDIMTRWHRMNGDPTLWLPGTDHAGIATQVLVEQELSKQGLTKSDVGRERFSDVTWEWAIKSRENINRQYRMLGASCDWTRDCFTLDAGPSRAVRTAFVRLYNKGLIYRGERMISWCPRCQTALSDLEVEHKDVSGHLYHIRYPLANGGGFVTIATTRPETFFGDTAVAVNPNDIRYGDLVGKSVILPIINKEIPIIADEAVEPSFGTGALKITPAHDPTDFAVGERHDLPLVNIMNPDATMNKNASPYDGLERFDCRDKVVADLRDSGLLERIEPYLHSVGHCTRCDTMVEPQVSLQWFVRTRPLADEAINAVEEGRITIIPERFTKVYFRWMEDIRDWCISRQLWWGHRIPVWYCQDCNKLTVSVDEPVGCEHCNSERITQDPDVLDTWFSSALWTHSTLGWPSDTDDLRYFYPTSVMETGYDILFFWVARMIMMGLEDTGQIPFHTVYLHGLLRDEHGLKMSKLRGNVINPTEAIEKYGVDALRFALTTGSSPGNDIYLGKGKLESGRNFVNKLWNATRFILRSIDVELAEGAALPTTDVSTPQRVEDRWIQSRVNSLISSVNRLMEDFQFGEAGWRIYDFLWSEFCDWYIEFAKTRLQNPGVPVSVNADGSDELSPLPFLTQTLEKCVRLLHPFMPFVTEELWQNLKQRLPNGHRMPDSIVLAPYPGADETATDPEAERAMNATIQIVHSIRNARTEHKVRPDKWIEAQVYATDLLDEIASQANAIETLARVRPLAILDRTKRQPDEERALVLVLGEAEVVLPWTGMADQLAARRRLTQDREAIQTTIAQVEARLRDNAFLSRAPSHVIAMQRRKLTALEDRLQRLKSELSQLD